MENIKTNEFSHLTAKERDKLSFPAKMLFDKRLLVGEVLDYGCGLGKDVELLKARGVNITGYDKFYFPQLPAGEFDTIICFYVLNVLLPEEQANVLLQVSHLLKSTGRAYFAVRRDIRFEGFRMHKLHQKPTYQCNVKLPYKSFFRNENCEIYEYQKYNQLSRAEESTCPFCQPDPGRELIVESATVYSMYDKYPVSKGHALVIPKRHCQDYFELTFKEQSACWFAINAVREIMIRDLKPDGFNIGININQSAGQTISHVHIHLVPRYNGDTDHPEGGVRGVIPDKRFYRLQ